MTNHEARVSKRVPAHRAQKRNRGTKIFLRDLLLIVVAAIILSVGIKTFLFRSFYIPSPSMTNTLQVNDRIIVNELVPGVVALKRGDVVVFKDPGGWLPPPVAGKLTGLAAGIDWALSAVGLSSSDNDDHLIKRVIGLPGDTVACCGSGGQLTVNGVSLNETGYVNLPAGAPASATTFSVTVPKERLWVMGDNRNNSADSRFHTKTPSGGFVPESDVVGRAFVITWPADRWTWLSDFPAVFAGAAQRSAGFSGK